MVSSCVFDEIWLNPTYFIFSKESLSSCFSTVVNFENRLRNGVGASRVYNNFLISPLAGLQTAFSMSQHVCLCVSQSLTVSVWWDATVSSMELPTMLIKKDKTFQSTVHEVDLSQHYSGTDKQCDTHTPSPSAELAEAHFLCKSLQILADTGNATTIVISFFFSF